MIFMTPEFEGLIKRELQLRKYELSGLGNIRQKGQFVEAQNLIAYSNELILNIYRYFYRYIILSTVISTGICLGHFG